MEHLYAYKGGSLFQPVYKGQRTDLDEDAATSRQLMWKKTTDVEPQVDA